MSTTSVCTTCERTENTCGCDFATIRTPEQQAQQDLYANATVPVRHPNDHPFSMRTFTRTMSDLLAANPDLFV